MIWARARLGDRAVHERVQARLQRPMLVVAALVVPLLLLENSKVGAEWRSIATGLDWTVWLAFAGEFVVLLVLAEDRARWLRDHPLDLAIVLLTPPFAPAAIQSARAFRLLRVLRLMRLAALTRAVFSLNGLKLATALAVTTALAGGAAFGALEHYSTADGIYWALTTMSTVGYGDITPKTGEGKALAITVMLVGIGFVAILTGAIAERFLSGRLQSAGTKDEEHETVTLQSLAERLDRIERALAERAGHQDQPSPPM